MDRLVRLGGAAVAQSTPMKKVWRLSMLEGSGSNRCSSSASSYTPNHSFERTASSRLRLLPAAAQVNVRRRVLVCLPPYRLQTVTPVPRAIVRGAFGAAITESDEGSETWVCVDGSKLLFRPSSQPELFYVEFQCQFQPREENFFGLLWTFVDLCKRTNGTVRVLRS